MNLKKKIMAVLPTPNMELLDEAHGGYENGFPISWAGAEKRVNEKIAEKIIKILKE